MDVIGVFDRITFSPNNEGDDRFIQFMLKVCESGGRIIVEDDEARMTLPISRPEPAIKIHEPETP